MLFAQYINYFIQSIKNRGCLFTLKLMYYELTCERQTGIKTLQIENLDGLTLFGSDVHHAHHYQAASYYILNELFSALKSENNSQGFIDFGCGKGRAMIVAAQHGFKEIYGVELARELCEAAKENIKKVKHDFPGAQFHVCFADAAQYYIPEHINVFYFFNPFSEIVMRTVLLKIQESINRKIRKVYILYINPRHAEVFTSNGYRIVWELKSRRYTEGLILTNQHAQ